MENASKALIMAAGVLIAVMILSLAMYLVFTFGSFSAKVHKENEENEIQKFNAQFLAYQGRTDISIYNIITMANYARENNQNYDLTWDKVKNSIDKTMYVQVILESNNNNLERLSQEDLYNLMKADVNGIKKNQNQEIVKTTYQCKDIKISDYTERVYQVVFKKNN